MKKLLLSTIVMIFLVSCHIESDTSSISSLDLTDPKTRIQLLQSHYWELERYKKLSDVRRCHAIRYQIEALEVMHEMNKGTHQ